MPMSSEVRLWGLAAGRGLEYLQRDPGRLPVSALGLHTCPCEHMGDRGQSVKTDGGASEQQRLGHPRKMGTGKGYLLLGGL